LAKKMAHSTRKKIVITNKSQHEDLSALVAADVLPQFLGGTQGLKLLLYQALSYLCMMP
jgi:hypothetical protein